MAEKLITQRDLKDLLKYNPKNGEFRWRKGGVGKRKDLIAGSIQVSGYRSIMIKGKRYYAHRLAWLYVYGYLPEQIVHHINHVKIDNRIGNLMEVSNYCNQQEKNINTSGKSGVYFDKRDAKWVVSHRSPGSKKRKYHGSFKTLEEACIAKDIAIEMDKNPHCELAG